MKDSYGKLILFRAVTAAIILFLIRQRTIPFDLLAMVIGIWIRRPVIRGAIFAFEILNLMVALLGLFFGNILGGLFGSAVYGVAIWAMCRPDIKERFV